MEAILTRTYKQKQTEGTFNLFDKDGKNIFSCKTLELPNLNNQKKISCIPEGEYSVIKITSPSQGLCFSVQNVPGRDHILIHKGNYAGSFNPNTGQPDILGCVLTCSGFSDLNGDGIPDAINSGATLKKLLSLTDGFELTIKSNPFT